MMLSRLLRARYQFSVNRGLDDTCKSALFKQTDHFSARAAFKALAPSQRLLT